MYYYVHLHNIKLRQKVQKIIFKIIANVNKTKSLHFKVEFKNNNYLTYIAQRQKVLHIKA